MGRSWKNDECGSKKTRSDLRKIAANAYLMSKEKKSLKPELSCSAAWWLWNGIISAETRTMFWGNSYARSDWVLVKGSLPMLRAKPSIPFV